MRGALRRLVLALAVVLVASPALAHRLKLFATVGDGAISGYGFFIGGGRPQGATIVIRAAPGPQVWRAPTRAHGTLARTPGAPGHF
nr:cobalamin biosynthesis protein CbiM [Bauldia sp.]